MARTEDKAMFDNVIITADFLLKMGDGKTKKIMVRRDRHPSDIYGDGSAHTITRVVDDKGNTDVTYLDTRYDMIQSDPIKWEEFWEAYLWHEYKPMGITRTYLLWQKANPKEGGER